MEKLKQLLVRLLFPGTAAVVLSVPVAVALLAYTFLVAGEDSPIAYPSYLFSAYSLTIVCASAGTLCRAGRRWAMQNRYVRRYLQDIPFKTNLSLHLSLAVNLLYAGMNAVSGVLYRSVWFGTLAAYYLFLAVMRFLLVRCAHRHGFGEDRAAEWRRFRLCGVMLVLMNVALAGVVVLVVHQNGSFHYAGYLIYAMALYTFYITIMAAVNLARYRKYKSPAMSAAKAINLAAALVSMLSLETAMLAQFGGGEDFRQLMTGATGGGVCVIVVGMGVYMTVHATRQLQSGQQYRTDRQV